MSNLTATSLPQPALSDMETVLVSRARAEHRGYTYLFPANWANQPTEPSPTLDAERVVGLVNVAAFGCGLGMLVLALIELVNTLVNVF
jgi:hypothetical protein